MSGGETPPEERNKMKEKFYTRYMILNILLLTLSLAFWLVISDIYIYEMFWQVYIFLVQ